MTATSSRRGGDELGVQLAMRHCSAQDALRRATGAEWPRTAGRGQNALRANLARANGYCELAADCGALPSALGQPRKCSIDRLRTRPLPVVAGWASSHALAAGFRRRAIRNPEGAKRRTWRVRRARSAAETSGRTLAPVRMGLDARHSDSAA